MGDPVIDYGNLEGDETLQVRGQDREGRPCGETFQTTVQNIANLGGSGGLTSFVEIISGTSVPASLQTYYGWNSASAAQKNIHAPAATGSLHVIQAIDMYGNAYQYPINFVPNGSDIVIGNQNQIYTSNGAATWRDLAPGIWGLE